MNATTYPAPPATPTDLTGELIPPATLVATVAQPSHPTSSSLPVTGGDVGGLALLGVVSFVVGAALTRRRSRALTTS